MNKFALTLMCLIMTGGLAAQAQAPALLPYKSAHWKQTVTMRGATPGSGQTIRAELWFLNPDRLRVVTFVEGKRQVIVIGNGSALIYEDGSDVGLKMPLQRQMVEKLAQFTEVFSKLDSWKKNKSGTENIGDKVCDIYSFTDTSEGQTVKGKVWLWAEKNFPLRMTQEMQGQSVTVEHADVEVDGSISPTLFEAPANMKFVQPPGGPGVAR